MSRRQPAVIQITLCTPVHTRKHSVGEIFTQEQCMLEVQLQKKGCFFIIGWLLLVWLILYFYVIKFNKTCTFKYTLLHFYSFNSTLFCQVSTMCQLSFTAKDTLGNNTASFYFSYHSPPHLLIPCCCSKCLRSSKVDRALDREQSSGKKRKKGKPASRSELLIGYHHSEEAEARWRSVTH